MPIRITDKSITSLGCEIVVDQLNGEPGGTAADLRRGAGRKYDSAREGLRALSVGACAAVPGYSLKSKYIVCIKGPVWLGGHSGEEELLASCYISALQQAASRRCSSIAFPLLSSGECGFPPEKVMSIAMKAIGSFLDEHEMDVYIVVPDKSSYRPGGNISSGLDSYIKGCKTAHGSGDSHAEFAIAHAGGQASYSMRAAAYSSENPLFTSPITNPAEGGAPRRNSGHRAADIDASISRMIRDMDRGFAETLFHYIDKKGISDVECYKRANVDKKTFSKIKCNRSYKPSKVTAVSFAIALRLDLNETNHLLNTVGMALSKSNVFDIIIEYFITSGEYDDIHDVNQVLYQFDQILLGC